MGNSRPVDPRAVRAVNLGRVLRAVLAADRPPSRAEVSEVAAITRATASRLVDDLLAGGVLVELELVRDRPGRPSTPLAARPGGLAALGLQVGVGSLAALAVDLSGAVLAERVEPGDHRASDPVEVLARLAGLAREVVATLPAGVRLVGTRVALPGLVSAADGVLLRAPNLGWSDVHVASLLGLGPVAIGNEADLAATTVSSERPGRAGRLRDFVYLSGETGIGGAVVVDGRPLTGRHGWAGEIGHVSIDPDGPACRCGSTGCLEQYAGAQVLATAAGLDPDAAPTRLLELVAADEPRALDALDRAAWALGCALAAVVNVVDVPVIVLGGHLRPLVPALRPRLEATLRERVLSAAWVLPSVEPAPDRIAPGALGAAQRELERVLDDPAAWLTTTRPAPAR